MSSTPSRDAVLALFAHKDFVAMKHGDYSWEIILRHHYQTKKMKMERTTRKSFEGNTPAAVMNKALAFLVKAMLS